MSEEAKTCHFCDEPAEPCALCCLPLCRDCAEADGGEYVTCCDYVEEARSEVADAKARQ